METMVKMIGWRWTVVGVALGSYLLTPTYGYGQILTVAYQVAMMFDRVGLPY